MSSGGCVPALTGLTITGPPPDLLSELKIRVDRAIACIHQSANDRRAATNAFEHLVQVDEKLSAAWETMQEVEQSHLWVQSAGTTRHIVKALQDALTSATSARKALDSSHSKQIFVKALKCLNRLWWWETYAVSRLSASNVVPFGVLQDAPDDPPRLLLHELAFLRERETVEGLFAKDRLPSWIAAAKTFGEDGLDMGWLSGTLGALGFVECLRKGQWRTPQLLTVDEATLELDDKREWLYKALYVRAHGHWKDILDAWLDGVMEWVFVDAPTPKTDDINREVVPTLLERRRIGASQQRERIEKALSHFEAESWTMSHLLLMRELDTVALLASIAMMGHVYSEELVVGVHTELLQAVQRCDEPDVKIMREKFADRGGVDVELLLAHVDGRGGAVRHPEGISVLEYQSLRRHWRRGPFDGEPGVPTNLANIASTCGSAVAMWLFHAGWPMAWPAFWHYLDELVAPANRSAPIDFAPKPLALRALRAARRRAAAVSPCDEEQVARIDECAATIAASYIVFYWEDSHEDVRAEKVKTRPSLLDQFEHAHRVPGRPQKRCPNRALAAPDGGFVGPWVRLQQRPLLGYGPVMDFPTLMREVGETRLSVLAKHIGDISRRSGFIDAETTAASPLYSEGLASDVLYMVDRLLFRHQGTSNFNVEEVSGALNPWLTNDSTGLAPCARLLSDYARDKLADLYAPSAGDGDGGGGGLGFQEASASFHTAATTAARVRRERSAETPSTSSPVARSSKVPRTGERESEAN